MQACTRAMLPNTWKRVAETHTFSFGATLAVPKVLRTSRLLKWTSSPKHVKIESSRVPTVHFGIWRDAADLDLRIKRDRLLGAALLDVVHLVLVHLGLRPISPTGSLLQIQDACPTYYVLHLNLLVIAPPLEHHAIAPCAGGRYRP